MFYRPDQVAVPPSFRLQHSLPQPMIVVLDSLGWERKKEVEIIRTFLAREWEVKERTRYPGIDPDFSAEGFPVLHPPHLPRQPNTSDCGIYAMEFAERTMKRFISLGTLKLVILVSPQAQLNFDLGLLWVWG